MSILVLSLGPTSTCVAKTLPCSTMLAGQGLAAKLDWSGAS